MFGKTSLVSFWLRSVDANVTDVFDHLPPPRPRYPREFIHAAIETALRQPSA
jgi:hypothetical protein